MRVKLLRIRGQPPVHEKLMPGAARRLFEWKLQGEEKLEREGSKRLLLIMFRNSKQLSSIIELRKRRTSSIFGRTARNGHISRVNMKEFQLTWLILNQVQIEILDRWTHPHLLRRHFLPPVQATAVG
jgi:hypothetical protein